MQENILMSNGIKFHISELARLIFHVIYTIIKTTRLSLTQAVSVTGWPAVQW